MHHVPGDSGEADRQERQRELGDGEAGDGLEERPEIGEERELAHEEQQDRGHAERDLPAAQQPEHVAAAGAPARRQRRHGDPLPDEREKRERHDEEEGAAPADNAPR